MVRSITQKNQKLPLAREMKLITVLFIFKVVTASVVLHQPQNMVPVEVGGTAVISCVSNISVEVGTLISWYQKTHRQENKYERIISCLHDNDKKKYECQHHTYETSLKIHKAQPNDSGIYYCVYDHYNKLRFFGNGTTLTVGVTPIIGSIHLFAPWTFLPSKASAQLACLVLGAHHIIHLTWNICGTRHKGKTITKIDQNSTLYYYSLLQLPQSSLECGNGVTCEIWFNSSDYLQLEIAPQKDIPGNFADLCQSILILVLLGICLFVLGLFIHFIWTLKTTENTCQNKQRKSRKRRNSNEIVYADLDMNHLTRGRK